MWKISIAYLFGGCVLAGVVKGDSVYLGYKSGAYKVPCAKDLTIDNGSRHRKQAEDEPQRIRNKS